MSVVLIGIASYWMHALITSAPMVSVVTKMRGRKKHPESLGQSGGFCTSTMPSITWDLRYRKTGWAAGYTLPKECPRINKSRRAAGFEKALPRGCR